MSNPQVSVIIPFFNASKYIKEAIESVLSQSYANWELILVNDGSTDSSSDIVFPYVSRHRDRMKILSHVGLTNRGTSASRNLGIKHARGNLLGFLDADDVWKDNFLEYHVSIFDQYPEISMSYGPGLWWHSWEPEKHGQKRDYVQDLGIKADRIVEPRALTELYLDNTGAVPAPSGVLFNREMMNQVGNWEEAFTGMCDDQAVYAKVCLRFSAYVSSKCLYYYRQHEHSLCSMWVRQWGCYKSREPYLAWLTLYFSYKVSASDTLLKKVSAHLWSVRLALALEKFPSLFDIEGWIKKIYQIISTFMKLAKHTGSYFSSNRKVLNVIKKRIARKFLTFQYGYRESGEN
ncbi:MAG: glycosyltransferase family 2 protein [Candidatus Brocadiaceae bacterium]|nr:glycosyltransferase family 2 protein [Candidatus Brocadiaceae bacterium]